MSYDKFHKAARDGYIDLLKQASRRELNKGDEDGMTSVHWAAYNGRLEALRVVVGRGGDIEKTDLWGNTALHHAANNNCLNCVSFLVNFGVNIWALDNEEHSALDLAAMKRNEDVVKFLDQEIFKQTLLNPKQSNRKKEKAISDYEKRLKKQRRRLKGENVSKSHPDLSQHNNSNNTFEQRFKQTLRIGRKKNGNKNTKNYSHYINNDKPVVKNGIDTGHNQHNVIYGNSSTITDNPGITVDVNADPPSLFDRPGFGCVSFRTNVVAETLLSINSNSSTSANDAQISPQTMSEAGTSTGSHWSKADSEEDSVACLETFLDANGLSAYFVLFVRERIGLDSLMLLNEHDIEELGLPMGPRKILCDAITRRKQLLQSPHHFVDIRL